MTVSRRTAMWSAVGGVSLVGVALTAMLILGPPGSAPESSADASTSHRPATGTVEQGTLTGTTTKNGKLSRLDGPSIDGSLPGVVTSLPKVGDSLAPGSELFRIDNVPVTAFDGALPQWRAFEAGMTRGPDVMQVEQNLKAWGYFEGTPDETFDARTSRGISAWQKATGQERTGSIALGAVQFVTGSFTVSSVSSRVGSNSEGPLYTTKRDDKVVTVSLPVGSPLARLDGTVVVALPGHGTAPGRVTDVGAPVVDESAGTTNVPVTVSLDDPSVAGDLTDASVQLDFVSAVKEDVLHVPVLALGAAVDGGFVVDVLGTDGTATSVPVETGLFAGDRVEVTGALKPGDEVVVPS